MRYALLVVHATKEEDNFLFILRKSVNCSANLFLTETQTPPLNHLLAYLLIEK